MGLSEKKKKEILTEESGNQECSEQESVCDNCQEPQDAKQADAPQSTDATEDLAAKLKEQEDKYLRLAAEYDNFKKRTAREKESIYTDVVASTMAQVLPVLDNLERAASIPVEGEEAAKVLEGVAMITKQFNDMLAAMGIEAIAAVGNPFDHCVHNAVMHIEDENCGENVVVEEFLKGYQYKDKVIRYSMVKVAN